MDMGRVGLQDGDVDAIYSSHENGCASAAVAVLLQHWKNVPYKDSNGHTLCGKSLADAIFCDHPPDAGHYGTTPGHLENMFKAYRLTTNRWCNNKEGGLETLQNGIQKLQPTCVLVDYGKLSSNFNFIAHYLIGYAYCDDGIYCSNMLEGSQQQLIDWNTFFDAWQCWFIPGGDFHYAGVQSWQ
jgi:hypothetical protein